MVMTVVAVMVIDAGDSDINGNYDGDNGGDNDNTERGCVDRRNGSHDQDQAKAIVVVMMKMQSAEAVDDGDDGGSHD